MAGNARHDLVSAFRSRIADDRNSVTAFSLSATGECKEAVVEITNGFLVVSVQGGSSVAALRLDLSSPAYSTVGRLVAALRAARGYTVSAEGSYVAEHPSTDLVVEGVPDIARQGSATFRHRMFSDGELLRMLNEAIALHNPSYSGPANVPRSEHPYVLLKAAAVAYRAIAADTAKRKSLDADANTFLSLAKDAEEQYRADIDRNHRIVPVAKADESKMGSGDIVVGTMYRRSLRSGTLSHFRDAPAPQAPDLYDAADNDVEDTQVRLRWSQAKDEHFSHFEVWRGTTGDIERSVGGRLGLGAPSPQLPSQSAFTRAGTAKQVLGSSLHMGPVTEGFFFWTAAEAGGASTVSASFIDGVITSGQTSEALGEPLEPETEYFYRVYAVNRNGEISASQTRRYRTKLIRGRFARTTPGTLSPSALSPQTGPLAGGTVITVTGTGFVTGAKLLINGKECVISALSATSITATSPAFVNTEFRNRRLDVVLVSPTGLIDIIQAGWAYT